MDADKNIAIKDSETAFWNFKYKNKIIKYDPQRDSYFHDLFKQPIKNLTQPAEVLEIACGVRVDGIELARTGHNLTETDISSNALEKAKDLFVSQNLTANFVKCDAENLPFENNKFDAVFTAASFHHFPDQIKALQEIKRVTKTGGLIILGVEPNAWPYYTVYLILKPIKWLIRKINPRPLNSVADDECWGFAKHKLKKLFKQSHIEIIAIQRVKYIQEFYENFCRMLSRLLKKNIQPNKNILKKLGKFDQILAKIPIINLFNWHWNIIAHKM